MKISAALLMILATILPMSGIASTFFFPANHPVYASGDVPKWLHDGHGHDGYVTVTTEVIPASSCVPLSNHSFWGGENTQLVLSVTTNGFKNKLDGKEIPIATFDGRDNGSQCATLSTLPMNVVPLALLGTFSVFNPGELSLVLNVKSASDSKQDFIGSAKFLLGAAAMVATGGSAAAIGGVASTVGNPILSQAQSRTNNLMKGMVNSKTKITLNWPRLRSGIRSIEIPVYRAESSLDSSVDSEIVKLQTDDNAEKTILFTVRFTFHYVSSLFDTAASDANGIPNPDSIAASAVLNYQMSGSPYNFLQLLNDSSPSLLQAIAIADGHGLTEACSIGLGKLKTAGLSNIDMAIVMKSFIDEAKGGAVWYGNPALVKRCFAQMPGIQTWLEKLYGVSTPQFVIGDVQDGVGLSYQSWRKIIGPVLSNFRGALTAKQDRINVLASLNGKHDIKVAFSPDMEGWQAAVPSVADPYPGIGILANREVRTIGCFIYKDADNLSLHNPGAYFIMEDMSEHFWLNAVKLSPADPDRILSLHISALSADWERYFESYNYPGGECAGILERYKKASSGKYVGD
ncbi:MAG: hypothetical protein ACYCSS_04700 [Sulfuriferula sp.]